MREIDARQAAVKAQVKQIEAPYEQRLRQEAYKKFPDEVQQAIAKPEGERTPGEQLLAQQVDREIDLARRGIDGDHDPRRTRRRAKALAEQIAAIDKQRPAPMPEADIVTDGDYRFSPDR